MKRILFITGTRADYGKIKSLMKALDRDPQFDVHVFVCGMHLAKAYGSTYHEVLKDGYQNVHIAYGLTPTQNSSVNLGNTIGTLSGYVDNLELDMIIVHGDRMDALAGAVVGALNNIIVAHIEGGELSGTIDESIRHAISKFAHIHFVCNEEAKTRLIQLGEEEKRIFVIGSPDIDIMLSEKLPSLEESKRRYEIPFEHYGILMYHPVTTEYAEIGKKITEVVDAVLESGKNYLVVYPNNDLGSEVIMNEYRRLEGKPQFRIFSSLRFESFLVLLKNADLIIGNSSAGIRESGIYGIPAVDIGTRQSGRYVLNESSNIQHVPEQFDDILKAIERTESQERRVSYLYGDGNSTERFLEVVRNPQFWNIQIQKHFVDFDL